MPGCKDKKRLETLGVLSISIKQDREMKLTEFKGNNSYTSEKEKPKLQEREKARKRKKEPQTHWHPSIDRHRRSIRGSLVVGFRRSGEVRHCCINVDAPNLGVRK
jgi:hypothetical protein